jgi:hypothetical protein
MNEEEIAIARAAVEAALAKCQIAATAAKFENAVAEAMIALRYFDFLQQKEKGKPPDAKVVKSTSGGLARHNPNPERIKS